MIRGRSGSLHLSPWRTFTASSMPVLTGAFAVLIILTFSAVAPVFFSGKVESANDSAVPPAEKTENGSKIETLENESRSSSGYFERVDGLHVTGKPKDIDIDTYRLRITGLGEIRLE